MKINISAGRKFRINGKEYGSFEEMPEEIRKAFEKVDAGAGGGAAAGVQSANRSVIVFNGVEYASLDAMPTYARNLYEQAMASEQSHVPDARDIPDRSRGSVKTESSLTARSLVAAVLIVALALLLYYLVRR